MKITIDTKEDSHAEISKVIKMLQHLVGESPMTNQPTNIFNDPDSFGQESSEPIQSSNEQPASEGIFSMFGNASAPSGSEEPAEEPEEKEETPEIIPY